MKAEGVRSAIDRVKQAACLEDFLKRREGRSRKRWVRTNELSEAVSQYAKAKQHKVSYGQHARENNCSRRTVRRLCEECFPRKNVTQIKTQRLPSVNVKARMELS